MTAAVATCASLDRLALRTDAKMRPVGLCGEAQALPDLQGVLRGSRDAAPDFVWLESNTTTARSQGKTSGNNAIAAMATYGFSNVDNVWLDIEAYTTSDSTCKAAVNAYVDGWDSVVAANYADAGVYGSASGSAVSSWATIAHPPSAVWIAHWDANLNSVWNDSYVSNSLWVPDERLLQYRHHKTYLYPVGCTTNCVVIDVDCADAWIDGGSLTLDNDNNEANEINSPTGDATCSGTTQ